MSTEIQHLTCLLQLEAFMDHTQTLMQLRMKKQLKKLILSYYENLKNKADLYKACLSEDNLETADTIEVSIRQIAGDIYQLHKKIKDSDKQFFTKLEHSKIVAVDELCHNDLLVFCAYCLRIIQPRLKLLASPDSNQVFLTYAKGVDLIEKYARNHTSLQQVIQFSQEIQTAFNDGAKLKDENSMELKQYLGLLAKVLKCAELLQTSRGYVDAKYVVDDIFALSDDQMRSDLTTEYVRIWSQSIKDKRQEKTGLLAIGTPNDSFNVKIAQWYFKTSETFPDSFCMFFFCRKLAKMLEHIISKPVINSAPIPLWLRVQSPVLADDLSNSLKYLAQMLSLIRVYQKDRTEISVFASATAVTAWEEKEKHEKDEKLSLKILNPTSSLENSEKLYLHYATNGSVLLYFGKIPKWLWEKINAIWRLIPEIQKAEAEANRINAEAERIRQENEAIAKKTEMDIRLQNEELYKREEERILNGVKQKIELIKIIRRIAPDEVQKMSPQLASALIYQAIRSSDHISKNKSFGEIVTEDEMQALPVIDAELEDSDKDGLQESS